MYGPVPQTCWVLAWVRSLVRITSLSCSVLTRTVPKSDTFAMRVWPLAIWRSTLPLLTSLHSFRRQLKAFNKRALDKREKRPYR